MPSDVSVTRNQIVDNRSGAVPAGLFIRDTVRGVIARDNWWGCNAGPPIGPAATAGACDVIDAFPAQVQADRWIVLGLDSPQATLEPDETADLTATLARTNQGTTVSGVFPAGQKLPFSATGGVLSDPVPPLTADAEADVRFRSTGRTGRAATARQDHQSVTVDWPDIPPVVTITSPADDLVTTEDHVVVRFGATPDGDGEPVCTPPDGTTVPIPVGESEVTVTCAYADGTKATATAHVTRIPQTPQVDPTTPVPTPTPEPTPTPTPTVPDLPACAKNVVIASLAIDGRRTRIAGRARRKFAGEQVALRYQPTGSRVIARPTVREDGTFSATVSRPAQPPSSSDQARYWAQLRGTTTPRLKLTRRMASTTLGYRPADGLLDVSGRVSPPTAPGQRLQVRRSDTCGNYETIGTLRVRSDGRFSGSVATAPKAPTPIPFIRLSVRVRSSSRPGASTFKTFSIVQPVPITSP